MQADEERAREAFERWALQSNQFFATPADRSRCWVGFLAGRASAHDARGEALEEAERKFNLIRERTLKSRTDWDDASTIHSIAFCALRDLRALADSAPPADEGLSQRALDLMAADQQHESDISTLVDTPPAEQGAGEPRGCPTPGACSCPSAQPVPPDVAGLVEAVRNVVRRAWELCDDTEDAGEEVPGPERYRIDDTNWQALADSLTTLEALIPKSEQPASAGHAVSIIATALEQQSARRVGVWTDPQGNEHDPACFQCGESLVLVCLKCNDPVE